MRVRDIMTAQVLTAARDTPVSELARMMIGQHVSGIPVVENGQVVGIVSESDLIVRNTRLEPPAFFQILDGRFPLETPGHYQKRLRHMLGTHAGEVMTEDVVTIGPEAAVEDLAALLVHRHISRIPVVEDGRLVGIVSRADIVRMMARELE